MTRIASCGRRARSDADAEHGDRGHAHAPEPPQQVVLAAGQPLVDLLEGEDLAVHLDEPHHVPRDAAVRDLEEPVVDPVLERHVPGQVSRPAASRRAGGR